MAEARVAMLTRFGAPLTDATLPLPDALADGAALIRMEVAGVCGSDKHIWQGKKGTALPHVLGHENLGIVAALGAGLDRDALGRPLRVGERVVVGVGVTCGHCHSCSVLKEPAQCTHREAYGFSYSPTQSPYLGGGYGEYLVARPGSALVKVDPEADPLQFAFAGCAGATMVHAFEAAQVGLGDTVVLLGAGPLAMTGSALATLAGARRVIVVGRRGPRLEAATSLFGATHTLARDATTPEERIDSVQALTDGRGADVVIECGGASASVSEGIAMLRPLGRLVLVGFGAEVEPVALQPFEITRKQLQVLGSWGSDARHLAGAVDLAERHQFRFADAVSHRYSLETASQALVDLAAGVVTKAVILPNAPSA